MSERQLTAEQAQLIMDAHEIGVTGECPNCFDDKTVTMSDGSKRPCELCAAGEAV